MSSAPERTFERNRGCYSCLSYENGKLAWQHWLVHRSARLAQYRGTAAPSLLSDQEQINLAKPQHDPRMKQLADVEKMVKTGCAGLCMKGARPKELGGPEGDFVAYSFLCDRWNGRDGHSVATAGKPLDKLNEELAIIAEERAERK